MPGSEPLRGTRRPILLLVAVLLSLVALVAHPYLPKHRWLIDVDGDFYDISSTKLADGAPAGRWTGAGKKEFSCSYPDGLNDSNYYCGWNRRFTSDNLGVDWSSFQSMKLRVRYSGNSPRIRLFARNFNPAYSTANDANSTQYNAVFLLASELDGSDITVSLKEFTVAEWWLHSYKIPRRLTVPDLSNVVTMGIDFSYPMVHGEHGVSVEKIELVGDWVRPVIWYLGILGLWLFGIFGYQINQLRLARRQREQDRRMIRSLAHDNRHLQEESSKFRRLSTVDPLTQTYNRFGIDQIVNALIFARTKSDLPADARLFCLVLLDIDHFKRVNDTHGHDVGDRVLQAVSATMQSLMRPGDYLGRWGGEEFLAVLPYTTLDAAWALAEDCRLQLQQTTVPLAGGQLTVTASFGVAGCGDDDFATAFKRADEALYDAKHGGRNRVVVAKGETPA
ncbi:MAG: GGDEF domain-containing protein [Rubrivivax sp.]|nr:MAG: GGDEF domain-containing protein [Rubrivivax sp.]